MSNYNSNQRKKMCKCEECYSFSQKTITLDKSKNRGEMKNENKKKSAKKFNCLPDFLSDCPCPEEKNNCKSDLPPTIIVNQVPNTCPTRIAYPDDPDCNKTNNCCIQRVPFSYTIYEAVNPTTIIPVPDGVLGAPIPGVLAAVVNPVDLRNWTVTIPDITQVSFEPVSGTITIIEPGDYEIKLFASFAIPTVLTGINASLTNVPYVALYDILDPFNNLREGVLPTVPFYNPAATPPAVTFALALTGQVTVIGQFKLVANQRLRFRFDSNGLLNTSGVPATITFAPTVGDTVLSVRKIKNSVINNFINNN